MPVAALHKEDGDREQPPRGAREGPAVRRQAPSNSTWRLLIAQFLLTTLLSAWCFRSVMNGYFLTDDAGLVADAAQHGWRGVPRLFVLEDTTFQKGTGEFGFYRPLHRVSIFLDYALWGANCFGYHLTNLLLHVCASVLVGLVAWRLTAERTTGLGCGLLFAVHPVHVEAVSWVGARADLLFGVFFLLAFHGLVSSRERASRTSLTILILGYSLSLLSKEIALTFPVVMVCYDLFARPPHHSDFRPWLRRLIPSYVVVGALSLAFLGARSLVLGTFVGGYRNVPFSQVSVPQMARVLVAALQALAVPVNQAIFSKQAYCTIALVTAGLLVMMLLVSAGRMRRRISLAAAFGLAWLALTLAPLLLAWDLSWDLCNSRSLYVPSFGICLILACLFVPAGQRVASARWCAARWLPLVLVVLAYSAILQRNCGPWREVGELTRRVQQGLIRCCASRREDRQVVFLDPPGSCEGATIAPVWVNLLLRPPFVAEQHTVLPVRVADQSVGDTSLKGLFHFYPAERGRDKFCLTWWDRSSGQVEWRSEPEALTRRSPRQCVVWTGEALRRWSFEGQEEAERAHPSLKALGSRRCLHLAGGKEITGHVRLDLEPSLLHTVHVVMRLDGAPGAARPIRRDATLEWTDECGRVSAQRFTALYDSQMHTYSVPIGFSARWLTGGIVETLRLRVPVGDESALWLAEVAVSQSLDSREGIVRLVRPLGSPSLGRERPEFVFTTEEPFGRASITVSVEWANGTVSLDTFEVPHDDLAKRGESCYAWTPSSRYWNFTMTILGRLLDRGQEVDLHWWVSTSHGRTLPFVDTFFSDRGGFRVGESSSEK